MASGKGKILLRDIHRQLKATEKSLNQSIKKLSIEAKKAKNKSLQTKLNQEQEKIKKAYKALAAELVKVDSKVEKNIERKTESLRKKVEHAKRMKSVVDANNLLLELKRKELLEKSADIESAYERISIRNEELINQKKEIDQQTELLREKYFELETKSEALLDQTDYLHEANETITSMHAELAKQKEEIEQKNEELLTLNTEKNNLIGIVAHDLKSPLNQIKGLISIIKITSQLEGEAANCFAMIESSTMRLSSMIAKILDIEAIESRQMNLNMESICLSDVLHDLATRFRIDAMQKKIELHEVIPSEVFIETDKNYFNQILENLLSNAIKFSPTEKNIRLILSDNEHEVIVEIKDEGPGLTDDDKKKLFSKYQKLSAKPTGSESSTGLGLSIVKKFVESMKGQIWCESEAGQGASFFVKFPKVNSLATV